MEIVVLVLLGLCFGSFVNALVWRLHEQSLPAAKRKAPKKDLSISKGRSMCVHCGHTLSTLDLLPVISWVALRGQCRYCKKPISWQYPFVELLTALLFVFSYAFWPERISGLEAVNFGLWLVMLAGLIALAVYDIRWMLLPNRIIFPLYFVAAAMVILKAADEASISPILSAASSIAIGGGVFYLLFTVSNGRWIGGGDVKLGFLLGAILSGPFQAAMMLFGASVIGTLYILPLLAAGKIKRTTKVPFGPFLIASAIFIKLFGVEIGDWYITHFIDV